MVETAAMVVRVAMVVPVAVAELAVVQHDDARWIKAWPKSQAAVAPCVIAAARRLRIGRRGR